jgi:hypothetical protein
VANAKSSTPSAFPPTDRPESALRRLLKDLADADSSLQDPKCATSERQIQVHIHDDENLFGLVDDSNRAVFELEANCPPSRYRDTLINAVSALTWAIKGREDTPATAAIRMQRLNH